MNLYQKLVAIRKTCPYLQKASKGHQFNYVSSSDTLTALRRAMDEHGVLLVPECLVANVQQQGKQLMTACKMRFTWVDAEKPDDRIVCEWYAQGLDMGEKGVGKAYTYAEKYFLLKFFNIATDADDPDAHQAKQAEAEARKPDPEYPWGKGKLSKAQRNRIVEYATKGAIPAELRERCGKCAALDPATMPANVVGRARALLGECNAALASREPGEEG